MAYGAAGAPLWDASYGTDRTDSWDYPAAALDRGHDQLAVAGSAVQQSVDGRAIVPAYDAT